MNNKAPLHPTEDSAKIVELQLEAINHRKMLLALGNDLAIRLHYGATTSCVEILTTLYGAWMNYDPENPEWGKRDRFILSKGHAAPSLGSAPQLGVPPDGAV